MARQSNGAAKEPLHVSLLALPDAAISPLVGVYDVLNAAGLHSLKAPAEAPPFRVEIVGEAAGALQLASGLSIEVQRPVETIASTEVIVVPSVVLQPDGWRVGRYPQLVAWLQRMHARGALLCSACSGIFLLAETGLWDGKDATVHFDYAELFSRLFPAVPIHPDRVLVISGAREELVSSGASTSWHDLVLYLTARHAGATRAQQIARLFALQWHQDGLAPFMIFEGRSDHGDALIQTAQQWLSGHFAMAHPVEQVIKRSKLAERTFKRRFVAATGLTPIAYVQRLRIEDAKRRLERTTVAVDEISWRVGYEDPAFFRRLFKRITGMAPGAYRRRFRLPDFARQ